MSSSAHTFSSLYILFYFVVLLIALENVESYNKICGTVFTFDGLTVKLMEDVTVTLEEFERVDLGRLQNAVFSPVSGCVIEVCGYTWKYEKTKVFVECKKIQQVNKIGILNIFSSTPKLEYYANYSCTCPNLRNTATSTASPTTILPIESTNPIGTTEDISTKKYSVQSDPGWCGFVNPRTSNGIVRLYENTTVDRSDLAKVQFNGAVKNGVFASKENCTLEICGYSRTAKDPYDKGTCEWYMGDNLFPASPDIYDKNYELTSLGCACRTADDANCSRGTAEYCRFVNDQRFWDSGECAVMFQETNCQSCYFKPISLFLGENFQSLNSFQVKSMIVRPGCTVDKQTKGNLWIDKESTLKLKGIVDQIEPVYHKDSENFTCNCSPEVIGTTLGPGFSTQKTTDPDERHALPSVFKYVMIVGGLVTVAVIVVAVILIRRQRTHRKFSSNSIITNLGSEQDERDSDYYQETFNRNVFKLEDAPEVQLVSNENSLSRRVEHPCLSLSNQSYESNYQNQTDTGKMEDKSTENQLKAEIMDEVKLLVESFLSRSAYNDGMHVLDTTQVLPSASDADCGPPNFNLIIQQFNQVCYPSYIIPREAFMVPDSELRNPLGVGQYGIVYKAVLREESDGLMQRVALKKIKWVGSHSFFREIKTFQNIGGGNEHIVKFLGACCHKDGLFLLTEYCEGGSLRDHVFEKMRPQVLKQSGPLPEMNINLGDDYFGINAENEKWLEENYPKLSSSDLHKLLYWSEQIADGMEFLSANRTIHDDLALRNIVLTKDLKVKICDFGLSRKCLNTEDCARSLITGDFPFNSFAPEFVNETVNEPRQVSLHVDIWAYGCTLYELFTLGDSMYQDVKEHGIQKFITVRKLLLVGYRHSKPLIAPESVYCVMMNCWNEVPKNRPSFTELRSFFEMERCKVPM